MGSISWPPTTLSTSGRPMSVSGERRRGLVDWRACPRPCSDAGDHQVCSFSADLRPVGDSLALTRRRGDQGITGDDGRDAVMSNRRK
jgi:hypothetical protein